MTLRKSSTLFRVDLTFLKLLLALTLEDSNQHQDTALSTNKISSLLRISLGPGSKKDMLGDTGMTEISYSQGVMVEVCGMEHPLMIRSCEMCVI